MNNNTGKSQRTCQKHVHFFNPLVVQNCFPFSASAKHKSNSIGIYMINILIKKSKLSFNITTWPEKTSHIRRVNYRLKIILLM